MATNTATAARGIATGRFIKALLLGKGDYGAALAYAAGQNWVNTPMVEVALRAAVNPVDATEPLTLPQALAYDFLEVLRPLSILGRLVGVRRIPFNTRMINEVTGASAAWIGEGIATPTSAPAFSTDATLTWAKVQAIAVTTNELIRSSAPSVDSILSSDLAKACAFAMDLAFVDPVNAGIAGVKPASVLFGTQSYNASGTDVASIDADIRIALSMVNHDLDLGSAYWLMRPSTCIYLSTLRTSGGALAYPNVKAQGGELAGIPILTSNAIGSVSSPSESFIALVIASEIVVADDNNAAQIDFSEETSIQMQSAPGAGPQQVVSLFQHNLSATRGTKFANWRLRRPDAVAVISQVQV
ncbi:MAG: phage major capsid protein [Burkholderiales bacterium]